MSFGSSFCSSYTKFVIQNFKFGFTCGESDLYYNIKKFQNIMTRIAALSVTFEIKRDVALRYSNYSNYYSNCSSKLSPLNTVCKLDVHKKFRRRPGRLLNLTYVQLYPVFRGLSICFKAEAEDQLQCSVKRPV